MFRSNGKKSNRARPRARGSAPLAEPLLRHLNGYGLAAGAAGVALLACSCPADAAPICGSLSVTLPRTETYSFNPAHEKVAPFNVAHTYNDISSHPQSQMARGFFTPNTPDAKIMLSTNGLPMDLASGVSIGPGGKFGKGKSYGLLFGYYYRNRLSGNFQPNQSGYVGFQFSELGQTHYGWLRLRVANLNGFHYPSLLLSEFGYEPTANTAILAGSCTASASSAGPGSQPSSVPAAEENAAHVSGASTTSDHAAIAAPEYAANEGSAPASLGLLALGSEGLALRRAKR